MQYIYKNKGVCSRETIVDIDENTHIINDVKITGGCDGNIKGLIVLMKGMKAEDAAKKMYGIKCGMKSTSCPDQVSKALEAALAELNK
ncbi:MAG: TIGR03905 family TSCPD domain-containing protein [Clostridia bacterium]|nr:TIGR03905 family TSCPD domain-containing protein [Clostridia bacterium]